MVLGFSSFGSFAATTLFALQQQQQPASNIVKRVQSIYRDLEPCNVTSFSYQRGAIQFSHVFPSQDARDELSANILQTNNSKSFLFHQIASSHGYTKPLLVYLPGMDAAGISAYTQFPSLAGSFELWRMTVDKDDCITTFLDLTNAAVSFINDIVSATANDRPVVLVGESFGGLLAPSVALRVQHKLSGLVLVNPATSFDQTQWTSLLPVVASIGQQKQPQNAERRSSFTPVSRGESNDGIPPTRFPTPYSLLGGLILSLTIPDQKQFGQIVNLVRNVPVRNQEDLNDLLKSLADGFHILQDRLPEATVTHRIRQWLAVGTQVINPRLGELRVKTVIVAGNEDKMLPTKQESTRLLSIIPNSTKIDIRNSGHFTLDDRVNLTHIILEESNIFPKKKTYDPILDWTPPTMEYTKERIEEAIKPLRLLTGPVFFSTDEKGIRHRGLGLIPPPNGGPILFVANHQFGGQDIRLLVPQLIEELGLYVRGLAHPILFQAAKASNGTFFGDPDYFKYGIVEVTPRNYYRLMETGQAALLFPGGVREVFHGKNEAYKLFWPEKVDFVRVAAKFNATIVPVSAVGAADSVNILIDPPDMIKLPFGLGERLENSSRSIAPARYDATNDRELFVPPFALPTPLPARHYFIFGKPIETRNIDPKDRVASSIAYEEIQNELNRGFIDVLRAREKDPYKDTARRILFELATGKSAPTFSVEDLNNNANL